MSKAQKQEVAVTQDELTSRAIAVAKDSLERSKALEELGVDQKDLVIPSVQVMQNTSELVGNEKAKLGDIVNMQTEEVLGGGDKRVSVLPLKLFKTLRVYSVKDGFKFHHEEPLTPASEKLPFEGSEADGTLVKRYPTINAFVLVKQDLDKGEGFPCLMRFKSTGMNAGKAIATHLYKQVFFKKRPYANFIDLTTRKENKGTNIYSVPSAAKGAEASASDLEAAEGWIAMLAAGNYRVDEREDIIEEAEGKVLQPTVISAEVSSSLNKEY